MNNNYTFKNQLYLLLLVISFLPIDSTLHGQNSKKGGYIYGWNNYTSDPSTGLGSRNVVLDSTDLRAIVHAPATGIHPRLYFGPSEIPDIKNRPENTISGQAVKANLHAYTTLLHLGSSYNQRASSALDTNGERHIDNPGAWNMEPFYTLLKNEDPNVWANATVKQRHRTAALMSHEAFMCLLYPNEFDTDINLSYNQRIENLTKAMYFWSQLALNDPEVNPTDQNFNNFGGVHMGLCYDLMYNYLTTEEQNSIRAALVKIIPDHPRHGGSMICYANTSNWSTLNSFEILINLAIENETGYKPQLTDEWMRAYHNFITYGWYPSGAGYEGLGKNYQFVTTMIAAAKRGYSLLSHPHVRAYGEHFLPAIMQPFGEGFTSYDVWGGSGYDEEKGMYKFNASDMVGLKWIFPNSEKIDFVWRNYISSFYKTPSKGYVYAQIQPDDSYANYLIPAAVFCQDYHTNTTWQAAADSTIETDYFASDRGLAVMKSSTSKEALAVQFHARQDMGGHTHGDRLDFTLSGLERIWVRKSYGGSPFQPSYFHSVILVDDLGIGVGDPDGDKCRQPAKVLHYNSEDNLSTISADATYAYTWEWHWSPQNSNTDHPWLGTNNWTAVTETWNDFQFQPQPEAHFNIPFYDFPHWHQAGKYEKMIKRPYNPMQKVVRNVGLIKGNHPMVLITDDIQKDEDIHNYKWVAQIARDLEWDSYEINTSNENYKYDIILKEPAEVGNRKLLIRILQCENLDGVSAPGYIDTLEYVDYFKETTYNSNPNWERKRLVIESNSVSPNYKILLYPFKEGQDLPITNWNTTKNLLEIVFPDQVTEVVFEKDALNNTQFHIQKETLSSESVKLIPEVVTTKLFPNPSTSGFNIVADVKVTKLELIDLSGRIIKTQHVTPASKEVYLNYESLPKSVYILRLFHENGTVLHRKIIVE